MSTVESRQGFCLLLLIAEIMFGVGWKFSVCQEYRSGCPMEISPASLAEREKLVDLRRKKSEDYVADLRHKGLHNLSGEMGCVCVVGLFCLG
jgi:hypothetical protein